MLLHISQFKLKSALILRVVTGAFHFCKLVVQWSVSLPSPIPPIRDVCATHRLRQPTTVFFGTLRCTRCHSYWFQFFRRKKPQIPIKECFYFYWVNPIDIYLKTKNKKRKNNEYFFSNWCRGFYWFSIG